MKTIHLPDDLEHFLHEAVRSGADASEESVISDALERLRQVISPNEASAAQEAEAAEPMKPLTKKRFQRHLVEIGLLDEASHPGGAVDIPDPSLIDDEGDVVSEMVIRERLIEWLAGFLP